MTEFDAFWPAARYAVLLGFGAWLRGYYGVGLTCGRAGCRMWLDSGSSAKPMGHQTWLSELFPYRFGMFTIHCDRNLGTLARICHLGHSGHFPATKID